MSNNYLTTICCKLKFKKKILLCRLFICYRSYVFGCWGRGLFKPKLKDSLGTYQAFFSQIIGLCYKLTLSQLILFGNLHQITILRLFFIFSPLLLCYLLFKLLTGNLNFCINKKKRFYVKKLYASMQWLH